MKKSPKLEIKNVYKNDFSTNKVHHDIFKGTENSETNISYNMPRDIMRRIKQRTICIDDVLDLHGYTLEEARKTFIFFIRKNFSAKKRLLIIITGKGGIIKSEIKTWISGSVVCNNILYWSIAYPRDGGDGAIYIYLRKNL